MTRLTILEHPDERLRRKAEPVTDFGPAFQRLVDDLFETMYASKSFGLAATQVDVHRRVLVMDVSGQGTDPQVFVNPEILSRRGSCLVEEGCVSVPGVNESVKRALQVHVRTHDRRGATYEHDLEGLAAVCLQHEMDHLAGMLFIDRLSAWRRMRLRARQDRALAAAQ